MEIEIQSKNVNPLMNRTEVYFILSHKGEGTPKRELLRGELAEKLGAKKEQVIIDHMYAGFGTNITKGYAKIYQSVDEAKTAESDYLLKRNALPGKKKRKKEVKTEGEDKSVTKESASGTKKPEEKKQDAEKPAAPSVKPASEKAGEKK